VWKIIRESKMNAAKKILVGMLVIGLLGACSNMNRRDKNTVTGATVGAVAGAILTGGSGIGTAGGAAVGGVIGNQIGR
jgi:osmotically inducible lipoprotein OsmB